MVLNFVFHQMEFAGFKINIAEFNFKGIFFPAMHCLVSKWSPPDEKGKFIATLMGGNLGTVFTFQLSGILTPIIGWRMVFYGEATLILIVTLSWLFLVANRPSEHHFISGKELQYIEESLGGSVSKKRVSQPFRLCIIKINQ